MSFDIGKRWRASGDFLFQEKSDGQWRAVQWRGLTLNCEAMPGGGLVVNDFVADAPLRDRWRELCRVAAGFPPEWRLCGIGSGGEYLEHILAAGGEGIVAKPLATGYGIGWLKCKRRAVFYGMVTELCASRGAARVALVHSSWLDSPGQAPGDFLTGDDGGWIALRSRFDKVRPGDVLKLEAYGQHASGALREARLDQDAPGSWLISATPPPFETSKNLGQ